MYLLDIGEGSIAASPNAVFLSMCAANELSYEDAGKPLIDRSALPVDVVAGPPVDSHGTDQSVAFPFRTPAPIAALQMFNRAEMQKETGFFSR
jgi:hypothetical protein